jgi:hypothetical protein
LDVVECVVVLPPEEFVVLVDDIDHGCQTKIAMRIAIRTMTTMPTAAALPPEPPSFTTTGPSAIQIFAPFVRANESRVRCPVIPTVAKRVFVSG